MNQWAQTDQQQGVENTASHVCEVCGRQDETLHYSSIPYVVSFVVITYRRSFNGLWAAVLTSTIGWLGFPFGIIYSFITLIKLAVGDAAYASPNAQLLYSLAIRKLQMGDTAGAIRCLEASLSIEDHPQVRTQLQSLYNQSLFINSQEHAHGLISSILLLAAPMAAAILIGMLAGLVSHFTIAFFSPNIYQNNYLLIMILNWLPPLGLGFLSLLTLRGILGWSLASTRLKQAFPAALISFLTALLVFFNNLAGQAIGDAIDTQRYSGPLFSTAQQTWTGIGALLSRGGIYELMNPTQHGSSIYEGITISILVGLGLLMVYAFLRNATQITAWNKELYELRAHSPDQVEHTSLAAWSALLAVTLVIGLCLAAFPQKTTVDFLVAKDHYWRGVDLLNNGKDQQASVEFESAVKLNPSFPIANEAIGWTDLLLGKADQAVIEEQKAISLNPSRASAHAVLGRAYYASGNPSKATEEFQLAIKLDPNSYQALVGQGWLFYDNQQLDQAKSDFTKAAEVEPQYAEPQTGLGYIYEAKEDYQNAKQSFLKAISFNANSLDGIIGLGIAYSSMDDLDNAAAQFEKAAQLDAANLTVQFYLSGVYHRRGEFEKAYAGEQKLIQLQPQWGVAHAMLAITCFEMDKMDCVKQEMDKAYPTYDQDYFGWSMLGDAYLYLHNFPQAEAAYQKAALIAPQAATYYLGLANVLSTQEKFDQAFQACDRAATAHANPVKVSLQMGYIYFDQGDYANSLQQFKNALAQAPDDNSVQDALGLAYYKLGNLDQAQAEIHKIILSNPYDGTAFNTLALIFYGQGKIDLAIEAAQKAIKLSPKYDLPHYVLGMCYLESGQKDPAHAELNIFTDLYWDRPSARTFKAKADEAINNLK